MAAHRNRPPEGALRESTYYILAVLSDGRAKSSAVIRKSVEERSAGRVKLLASSIISLLNRYSVRGLVEIIDDTDVGCKRFRLTELGHTVWEADVARLRHRLLATTEYELRERRSPAHEG